MLLHRFPGVFEISQVLLSRGLNDIVNSCETIAAGKYEHVIEVLIRMQMFIFNLNVCASFKV